MATNPDFRYLLSALSAEGADFIVVGANKRAAGRPQDLLDVERLEKLKAGDAKS
jgi:hypothetical protein